VKVKPINQSDGVMFGVSFVCPGCGEEHEVRTRGEKAWEFNGDFERPTLFPDILAYPEHIERDGVRALQPRCHSQVNAGRITFFADSEHALAGSTIELPEILAESKDANSFASGEIA